MPRPAVQFPGKKHGEFEIVSRGRRGSGGPGRFGPAEIALIARTVRRAPEAMVKVTGGGTKAGAVAAHLRYIGRRGELEVESDDGRRLSERTALDSLLDEWNLDLTSGQYRPKNGKCGSRPTKLVHNIVLSMPSRTPPDKVLSAAKKFARERFALQHRYAMVLHADQANPHVHLVVKAESESGKRLHIDKAMLRDWREQFAALMREQGIAANATPRAVRGKNRGKTPTGIFAAHKYGKSTAMRQRVTEVARELHATGTVRDPSRPRLIETRRALMAGWQKAADTLERQGESGLADEVRRFVENLPPAMSDRQALAIRYAEFSAQQRATDRNEPQSGKTQPTKSRDDELTR